MDCYYNLWSSGVKSLHVANTRSVADFTISTKIYHSHFYTDGVTKQLRCYEDDHKGSVLKYALYVQFCL